MRFVIVISCCAWAFFGLAIQNGEYWAAGAAIPLGVISLVGAIRQIPTQPKEKDHEQ